MKRYSEDKKLDAVNVDNFLKKKNYNNLKYHNLYNRHLYSRVYSNGKIKIIENYYCLFDFR